MTTAASTSPKIIFEKKDFSLILEEWFYLLHHTHIFDHIHFTIRGANEYRTTITHLVKNSRDLLSISAH